MTCVSCAFCSRDGGPRLYCAWLHIFLESIAGCDVYVRSVSDGQLVLC